MPKLISRAHIRILTATMLILVSTVFSPVLGKILWVDVRNGSDATGVGSEASPFASIWKGLGAVVSLTGDTVMVKPGTYNERVVINKRLVVKSQHGRDSTIIDGHGMGAAVEFSRLLDASTKLEGFWIRGGSSSSIDFNNGVATVINCKVDPALAGFPMHNMSPSGVDDAIPTNIFVPRADGKFNAFYISPGSIVVTSHWPSTPDGFAYYLFGSDTLNANQVWSIGKSSIVKLGLGSKIVIRQGTFTADSVLFTSAQDDAIGGDCTGNGPTTGEMGMWGAIVLQEGSNNSSSLTHCTLRYGGSFKAALVLEDCSPTISNCLITLNACGLSVKNTLDCLQITDNQFRDNYGWPARMHPEAPSILIPNNEFVPRSDRCYNAFYFYNVPITHETIWPTPPQGFSYYLDTLHITLAAGGSSWTIAPNTVVKFRGGSIAINSGSLRAQNVLFTRASDDTLGVLPCGGPQNDLGMTLQISSGAGTNPSILEQCSFRYSNISTYSSAQFRNCTFSRAWWYPALRVFGDIDSLSFMNNTFVDNDAPPLQADPLMVHYLVPRNNFLAQTRTCDQSIVVDQGIITRSITWPTLPQGYCYSLSGQYQLNNSNGSWVIGNNNIVKADKNTSIDIVAGSLSADRVTFTSIHDDTVADHDCWNPGGFAPGQWLGIRFLGTTVGQSALTNCVIRGGGGLPFTAAVTVDHSGPTVSGCVFEYDQGAGLELRSPHDSRNVTGNIFRNNQQFPVRLNPNAVSVFVPNNTLEPNASQCFNAYYIITGILEGSHVWPVPSPPFCYAVDSFTVAPTAALHFQPGTIIKLILNARIRNQGELAATGALFTSWNDDTLGNIDCSSSPVAYGGYLEDPTTLIQCTVRECGTNISLKPATIRQCIFENSFTGLSASQSLSDIACCIFRRNRYGFYGTNVTLQKCSFIDNSQYGVFGQGVDARNCWWGFTSGPSDTSVGPPDFNPNGVGDKVSDNVQYRPWLLDLPSSCLPPHLHVVPDSMLFRACQGGLIPATQDLNLSNSGGDTLHWNLATSATWITLSAQSGTGNSATVHVSMNTTNKTPGLHYDSISVTCPEADNSPMNLRIRYLIDVPFTTRPSAPVTTAGCDYIDLNWSNIVNASAYSVYRDGSKLATVVQTSWRDLAPGSISHCYRITASNTCGESQQSDQTCGSVSQPPSVALLSVPVDGDSIRDVHASPIAFSWNPVQGAASYQLQIAVTPSFTSPIVDVQSQSASKLINLPQGPLTMYWRVRASNSCGFGNWSTVYHFWYDTQTGVEELSGPELPTAFQLSQNYPNPFNPETFIEFALPRSCFVSLEVYDIMGRRVATLIEQYLTPGLKRIVWDGRDNFGGEVASGVYLYKLNAGNFSQTRKMVLLK